MAVEIILNRIRCNICEDVITSHSIHDYKECLCGASIVDGGRAYLKRKGNSYTELSVMSDAPFEVIRQSYYRGTRGPNNDGLLEFVLLCDMSDAHLENTIAYVKSRNWAADVYEQELKYRIDNSIFVSDKT